MGLLLILVALIVPVLLLLRPPPRHPAVVLADAVVASDVLPTAVVQAALSPLFTPEVQYWGAKIMAWAAAYELPPNMVATVMQIESCGNPAAVSPAGAQGLFQVMPFHFEPGETMQDPDTNARRGMQFLASLLAQTGGIPAGLLPATTAAQVRPPAVGLPGQPKHSAITPGAAVSMRK